LVPLNNFCFISLDLLECAWHHLGLDNGSSHFIFRVKSQNSSTPDSNRSSISSSDSEKRSPSSVTAATLVAMSSNGHSTHECYEDDENTHSVVTTAPAPVRMKRQQIPQACDQCKKLHAKCCNERPCKRCQLNGTADSCSDTPRRYRGRNGKLRTLALPTAIALRSQLPPDPTQQEEVPTNLEEIQPKTDIAKMPKIVLPDLLPELSELTCPDPLKDDTVFFNTALKPNPRKRIFQNGEEDFDTMHFAFEEEDFCFEEDTPSTFQWQSLLSPSFISPTI